jgi:hypothetical protein
MSAVEPGTLRCPTNLRQEFFEPLIEEYREEGSCKPSPGIRTDTDYSLKRFMPRTMARTTMPNAQAG